ncbi:MAG: FtsX-like permease family protein [Gemmatimonadota bacterium]|nr:FtsX-like permease family protein [Gemmatimonadota bacterium]
MAYELFIAHRYLRSKRRTRFVSIITYISVGGVLVGVAALVIVLSLFNGFESEVRSRIIGERAHINVLSLYNNPIENYQDLITRIEKIEHVEAAAPYILDKAVFTPLPASRGSDGVVVIGVDPEQEMRVTRIHENVIFGTLDFSDAITPGDTDTSAYPGIVLGRALADEMGVMIGQKVALVNIQGLSLTSVFQPYVKKYRVAGIIETGFYEYDRTFVYLSLEQAQTLFRLREGVRGISVRLDDRDMAREIANTIESALNSPPQVQPENSDVADILTPAYFTINWMQRNKGLFRWMTLEKWGSFAILNLIILVAAFNIVSTLIMVVLEKTKDIGILKSMGATSKSVMKIFIFQGSVVGIFGTILGCLVGYMVCWAQDTFEIIALPPDIYLIDALPVQMHVGDFMSVALGSIVICVLATIYPAWKAAHLIPVEAIRYE